MTKPKKTQTPNELPRWKTVEEMTGPEVVREAESLASYAEGCRRCGDGINSKESIRFNKCISRIETERLTDPYSIVSIRCQWDERLESGRDLLLSLYENGGTLEGMQKLFAPV
jgi:hypothetical protein